MANQNYQPVVRNRIITISALNSSRTNKVELGGSNGLEQGSVSYVSLLEYVVQGEGG